jgi:hypothetical protein
MFMELDDNSIDQLAKMSTFASNRVGTRHLCAVGKV